MMEFARDGSWAGRFFDAAEERTLLRLAAEVAVAAREGELAAGGLTGPSGIS